MKPNDRTEVHFLNVDHGDCTIIRHPGDEHRTKGRISVVDINDWKGKREITQDEIVAGLSEFLSRLSANSRRKSPISEEDYAAEYLNDPTKYFQNKVAEPGQSIWRFIPTHPDMDHLSGLKDLDEDIGISVIWDSGHNRELSSDDDWGPIYDPEDWEKYQEMLDGDQHNTVSPLRGDLGNYWEDDNVQILYPTEEKVQELNNAKDRGEDVNWNNISYVLKLDTPAGAIILPGDAEDDVLEEILNHFGPDFFNDVFILKAPHHGRKDGYLREFVKATDPEYVVVSVGNKDGQDAYDNYNQATSDEAEIISTRQYGAITATVTKSGASFVTKEYEDGIFDIPEAGAL